MYSNQPTWIFIDAILRGISETSHRSDRSASIFCHSQSEQALHVGVIKTGSNNVYIKKASQYKIIHRQAEHRSKNTLLQRHTRFFVVFLLDK